MASFKVKRILGGIKMIPKHKCTPYCDPDEGIHCLIDTWMSGMTKEQFQVAYDTSPVVNVISDVEIIKVQQDSDVTGELFNKFYTEHVILNRYDVGYLVWVREKSWKSELNWIN